MSDPAATVTFTIPNAHWLTSNMRLHWAAKAKRVAWLRDVARVKGLLMPRFTEPVRIVAWIGYASATRADPINASSTGKPLIDGLVSAGVFPDDSDEWVAGPDYRRDPEKCARGLHTVRLEIYGEGARCGLGQG